LRSQTCLRLPLRMSDGTSSSLVTDIMRVSAPTGTGEEGSSNKEPVRQRVALVHNPIRKTADICLAFDFRDNSLKIPNCRFAQNTSFENCSDDGLIHESLILTQFTTQVELRNASRGSRAGRRTIHLAIGEHAAESHPYPIHHAGRAAQRVPR
jgi:hypothetical protein